MENHWSQEIWPPSSPDYNLFDPTMWSVFEREVKKQPHSTLASLRAKILEVMADLDREVDICSYKKFWSRMRLLLVLEGISLNNCVCNMHLHFS
jgi:hypothetical protein